MHYVQISGSIIYHHLVQVYNSKNVTQRVHVQICYAIRRQNTHHFSCNFEGKKLQILLYLTFECELPMVYGSSGGVSYRVILKNQAVIFCNFVKEIVITGHTAIIFYYYTVQYFCCMYLVLCILITRRLLAKSAAAMLCEFLRELKKMYVMFWQNISWKTQ